MIENFNYQIGVASQKVARRRMIMKNENVNTKTITWNDAAKAIVKTLADSDKPLTLAEINAISGVEILPGNITGLVKKGVILNVGKTVIATPSKRKVSTYAFVTAEPQTNPANGKICNYTETETAILATMKDADEPMTLAQISEAMGRALISGNINGLVTKGNVAVAGEVEVPCMAKKKVSKYVNNEGAVERVLGTPQKINA